MIKNIILAVLMVVLSISLQAQNKDETPVISGEEISSEEIAVESPVVKPSKLADKVNVNLTAGTSFFYSKGFGNGLSNYIAPRLTYKFTPRVNLNVGVMFINSNVLVNRYTSLYNEQSVVVKSKPVTSTLAFVSGDYLVNERLTISGMIVKDLSNTGYGNYNPAIQSMSLHLDYKLTKNISVGAGMHMSQGSNWGYPASNYGFYPSNQFSPLFNY